jgi:acetyl-CoA carboxylase biotin carboxyl carrier protein
MARIEVLAEVTGKVWKIQIMEGVLVKEDDSIMIIESMKMEIPVFSTDAGQLIEILVKEGDAVEDGQVVAVIEI